MTTRTPAQEDAITRVLEPGKEGPGARLVCIAGAGAGKTDVLTNRVAHLIDTGTSASSILALTFTRAAAGEMRERLQALLGRVRYWPEIRTLHSWCASFLRSNAECVRRTPSFSIYDDDDQTDLIRSILDEMGRPCPANLDVKRFLAAKNNADVRDRFADRLRAGNALTYDQLERFTAITLRDNEKARTRASKPYRHILVDEGQDLSEQQAAIIHDLTYCGASLFVVGDTRQAIYSFRGGTPKVMQRWAAHGEIVLAENFRSLGPIVNGGNVLMKVVPDAPQMVVTRLGHGHLHAEEPLTEEDEAHAVYTALLDWHAVGVPWDRMAVLARTWRCLDLLHAKLKASDAIPYRYYGDVADALWSSREARAVARLAWLCHNPADDNMCEFIALTEPKEGFTDLPALRMKATRERTKLLAQLGMQNERYLTIAGSVAVSSLDLLLGWIAAAESASLTTRAQRFREAAAYVDALGIENFLEWWTDRGLLERQREAAPGVSLMTIHAAKGLQWDAVAVMGTDQMPGRSTDDDARAEERRVMYVAITRARDRLLLTRPKTRQSARSALNTSAPFLDELLGCTR